MKLAVIILTHNEERHIAACIESAAFADEILVIDDHSTDRTAELARAAGARVIARALAGDFAAQRNFALTQTDADWVLYVDADERVQPETEAEIARILAEDARAVYEIKRINVAFGRRMYYGGHRPDYSQRLYPRMTVHWVGRIHEHVVSDLPIRRMGGILLVRHENLAYFLLCVESIIKRQNHPARVAEQCINALLPHTRQNRLRTSHTHASNIRNNNKNIIAYER